MIGPTAPDSAKITPNATGTMRPMIAQPATAASPKRAISAVTKALPTGVAICVMIAGSADREERPRRGRQPLRGWAGAIGDARYARREADAEQHEARQHSRDRRAVEAEVAGRK